MDGTGLYERLASHGYVVAGVGHSGSAVEDDAAPDRRDTEVANRVSDLRYVLARLLSLPGGGAEDSLNGHIRADRVGLVGRGNGGAAAADLAAGDARVTAVAAITPDTLGDVARRGVRRPFLVFTIGEMAGLEDALRYGGTEARLEGTTPGALSEVALVGAPIVKLLGITSRDTPRDVQAAVSALTLRFLDQYLKERREETQVEMPSRVSVRIIPHRARAN